MTARRRILIIDDETRLAFFLRESLESRSDDFEIVSVSLPEQALDQIRRKPFDLLVIDQHMPDMDDLDLVGHARQLYPDIRFILITAYLSEDVLAKARQTDAFRCFVKPFHIEDFVQTVLEALQADDRDRKRLPNHKADVLSAKLEELRREVGAQCVLAAGAKGQLVAQAGALNGLDIAQLLRLAADGFAASWAMAHYLGGTFASNLNYHEGREHDVYMASINKDLFLALVFDRRVQASRIGIVWLYAQRAIESLRRMMTPALVPSAGNSGKKIQILQDQLASVDSM